MDEFGWYLFEGCRVTPRVQLVARQEDFQRPARGTTKRVRGLAGGANVEIAPNRVRLLLEGSRRISGQLQTRSDSFIAQLQVVF
jgi:PP-loop superfamily ATP-utilizing enzyme